MLWTDDRRGGSEKIVSSHRTSANCWCFKECKEDPIILPVQRDCCNDSCLLLAIQASGRSYSNPKVSFRGFPVAEICWRCVPRVSSYFQASIIVYTTTCILSRITRPWGQVLGPWLCSCISVMWRKAVKLDSLVSIYQSSRRKVLAVLSELLILGRMVVWPSVLDHDPFAQDDRTYHEAKTVIKGTSSEWNRSDCRSKVRLQSLGTHSRLPSL